MALRHSMTVAAYARSRNIGRSAILQQIQNGVIERAEGLIDPDQADAAWANVRRARTAAQNNSAGVRSANAKIGAAVAKLRLANDRYEGAVAKYDERDAAIQLAAAEAVYFTEALRAAPARYTDNLAQVLAIEPRIARRVLNRFTNLVAGEIGDLRAAAVRAAESA